MTYWFKIKRQRKGKQESHRLINKALTDLCSGKLSKEKLTNARRAQEPKGVEVLQVSTTPRIIYLKQVHHPYLLPPTALSIIHSPNGKEKSMLLKPTSMEKGTRRACNLLLVGVRIMAMAATLSATAVTVTSRERVIVFNVPVNAKYHYSASLKFFAIANAIASAYSLVVVFVSATKLRPLVVASDAIVTMLLVASGSAALAIGHVGKKGNSHAGWMPICGQVPKFCDHVMVALILGSSGVFIYMFLLLHAIHTSSIDPAPAAVLS